MRILFVATIIFFHLGANAQILKNRKPLFEPSKVKEISWTADGQTVRLKNESKNQETQSWKNISAPKDFKPDDWGIHRRLVLLSTLQNSEAIDLTQKPLGKVEFKSGPQSLEAEFNEQGLKWTSGDDKGNGYLFSKHPELKELFDEGIKSLARHEMTVCDPEKVTTLDFVAARWSVAKNKNKWTLNEDQKQNPARPAAVSDFLKYFCHFKVDHFFSENEKTMGSSLIIKITEGKKEKTLNQLPGDKFIFTNAPMFKSKIFEEFIKVVAEDFKDPSLEAGRIAVDPHQPQNTRIQAIRKIKDSQSVEGIPALKILVDEKTEIDLYRYEAVDALAAVGTKEAYKIIADRLAEVGRSGFELRLARALALGMGHNFVSDEKSPEPQRRAEVQDLLATYRKNPPGK